MTGEGQAIEVPMFETMAQFVLADHMGGSAFVPPLGAMGYKRLLSRTRGPYATKDGHLSLVVYTDRHWRDFTKLVGCPDLIDNDERFRSQESRTRHAEDVGRFLADRLTARSNDEWLEALHEIDIPACPVNAIEDLFEDPHLKAVGFFRGNAASDRRQSHGLPPPRQIQPFAGVYPTGLRPISARIRPRSWGRTPGNLSRK